MRSVSIAVAIVLVSASFAAAQGRYGFRETCNDTKGWYQWDADRNPSPIQVKLRSENGKLIIPLRRTLLRFAWNRSWVAPGIKRSAIICKEYGEIDLDKYHYLLCRIVEKGSAVFVGINGFDTKLGYTTGLTVIDITDYDEIKKGKRNVRIELDLHENSTTFILDEIALVSELTDEEKKALIGKGVVPRKEKLKAKPYHGLEALKARCGAPLFPLDRQEQAIHRDSATGAVVTRLTAGHLPDFFGEGEIWSADGKCIFFAGTGRTGTSIYYLEDGRVQEGPSASKMKWSPVEPTKLYLLTPGRGGHEIRVWDRETGETETIATVKPKRVGGYTEFGVSGSGLVTVAYRETPYAFVIDPKKATGERVETIELPTTLKGFSYSREQQRMSWANCYTYERLYKDLKTGKVSVGASFFAGHASRGATHTVGEFGRHLKLLVKHGTYTERRPGDEIKIWANYGGDVVTDYGRLTRDAEWIITNGTRGDVANQHVMIPTKDPGSILRLTRYFSTYYTWNSATYSRPSPDYTKVVFMQDVLDNPDLHMVYTRRPDPPRNVKLANRHLSWEKPKRSREIAGYNVYRTSSSGRNYERINRQLVKERLYELEPMKKPTFYAVTAVEHSGCEGLFSEEAVPFGPRTILFEAERAALTPPARIVYDGRCSDFRYVRITPGTSEEKTGQIAITAPRLGRGDYKLWVRTRGTGAWRYSTSGRMRAPVDAVAAFGGFTATRRVTSPRWQWVPLVAVSSYHKITLSSETPDLALDCMVIQPADAPAPTGVDPRDVTPPPPPTGLRARALPDGAVKVSWYHGGAASPTPARDFSHFSVYAAPYPGFVPSNATLIRSVKGSEITDTGVRKGSLAWYKVVAYDSRMNPSKPATVHVHIPGIPYTRTCQAEAHLADHLKIVAGPRGITYVTNKGKEKSWFEIPVDVPFDGWYRLWLDYTTPYYAGTPVQLSVDGNALGNMGATFMRTHPRTVSFRRLNAKNAHLFSDPIRLTHTEDTFRLTKGKHTLRVSWKHRQPLFDKVHLTNDPAFRPPAYDALVRPHLKGRGL